MGIVRSELGFTVVVSAHYLIDTPPLKVEYYIVYQ